MPASGAVEEQPFPVIYITDRHRIGVPVIPRQRKHPCAAPLQNSSAFRSGQRLPLPAHFPKHHISLPAPRHCQYKKKKRCVSYLPWPNDTKCSTSPFTRRQTQLCVFALSITKAAAFVKCGRRAAPQPADWQTNLCTKHGMYCHGRGCFVLRVKPPPKAPTGTFGGKYTLCYIIRSG